jgi:two-component system, LuxR family, sensor kinase FixL
MTDNLEQNRKEITGLLNRLRNSNEELTENQARLRAVFETSADAIITIRKGNQIEEVNEAAVRMFGFTRSELTSKTIQDILPAMGQPVEQLLNNSTNEAGAVSRPCIGIREDTSTFPVGCSCSLAEWGDQKIAAAIARDLTYERKLERNMLDAGLKERSKIGHEIHEGLGQTLTGLHFIAGQIARRLAKENHPVAGELEEIADSIRVADRHAQQLFQELVIVEHAMGGLVRSFQLLSELSNGNSSCNILVEADQEFRCDNNTTGVHIFHIVKDGVENAIDQDNPEKIQIICSKNGGISSLTIQYTAESRSESEPGAITDLMKYRANLLGGTISSEFNTENHLLKVECKIPASVMKEGS